ncbi:MFS transporter [Halobacillus andaensis]|uniref:MFS transporter n=1 Tax=Halobacillus andaensis TaxID=1176239 RepID=A0A917EVM0_HALAA|nr:MFS transporter [Halobacillus andaensis]MBP2003721.1 MFS family permease [Halobacillus andaensis]GGF12699.1 MFS transporter [Halobacillus andaensis]
MVMFDHFPSYLYLFRAGIVNGIGDRFSQVAVLALVLEITGSGLLVGLVMGIRVVPYLIFSLLGGKLADRFNRRMLMIVTDLIRFPFALIFLFVESSEQLWILYVGVAVLACGEAFYQPVRKSTIGSIVKKNQLAKVNALEQVIVGVVLILGSISGGVVAFFLGEKVSFILNAVTFLVAAWFLKKLPDTPSTSSNIKEEAGVEKSWNQVGFVVWTVIIIQLLTPVTDGIFNVLISLYGAETFQLGDLGIGLLYGALGAGLVLSFYITSLIKKRMLSLAVMAVGMEGAMQITASVSPSIWLAACLFVLISAVGGVSAACLDTIVMSRTKPEHQGRVFGLLESLTNTQLGLAMLAAGILVDLYSPRWVGMIGGMLNIAIAALCVIFLFTLRKKVLLEKTSIL